MRLVEDQRSLGSALGRGADEVFLDATIDTFQPYSRKPLTREDAREIAENVTGLFGILLRLKKERMVEAIAAQTALPGGPA